MAPGKHEDLRGHCIWSWTELSSALATLYTSNPCRQTCRRGIRTLALKVVMVRRNGLRVKLLNI
jgi:hypothetical protein